MYSEGLGLNLCNAIRWFPSVGYRWASATWNGGGLGYWVGGLDYGWVGRGGRGLAVTWTLCKFLCSTRTLHFAFIYYHLVNIMHSAGQQITYTDPYFTLIQFFGDFVDPLLLFFPCCTVSIVFACSTCCWLSSCALGLFC